MCKEIYKHALQDRQEREQRQEQRRHMALQVGERFWHKPGWMQGFGREFVSLLFCLGSDAKDQTILSIRPGRMKKRLAERAETSLRPGSLPKSTSNSLPLSLSLCFLCFLSIAAAVRLEAMSVHSPVDLPCH